MRRILLAVLAIGLWSCQSQSVERSGRTLPKLACLSPDSGALAFGRIAVDSAETGDASGVQFTFELHGDSLRGFVRDARGEIPPRAPLKGLQVFSEGDSISFWYGDKTKYFRRYQLRCDSLSGSARFFVTASSNGVTRPSSLARSSPITAP